MTKTLSVKKGLVAGIDIGGTKIQIADSENQTLKHFRTKEFQNVEQLLERYFSELESLPERVVMDVAGPRDDETGEVRPTNFDWPPIRPAELEEKFSGTQFITIHDLAAAAAGALQAPGIDLLQLKSGTAKTNGPIIAVTIGTGLGVCAAIWDERSKRRIFFSGEAGHMGFMPYSEPERRHLEHLFKNFDHPSAELAINGKHGVDGWLNHSPELQDAEDLKQSLEKAKTAGRPTGAVLLEFATEGNGADREAAQKILNHMGKLVGNILADFALAYRATGGIYLTGSVSHGLSEYWAENTDFAKAFVRQGTADHAPWLKEMLEHTPIYLLLNPDIAAIGALAIAKED